MITATALTARAAPVQLRSVSLAFGPGAHALLGTPADGAALALAVFAGRAPIKAGEVTVLGGRPDDPKVRAAIGHVPLTPRFPDALRVHEVLALADNVRGEPRQRVGPRLALLGLEALERRAARSLAPEEARAVLLCEALTSKSVRVILVDEPFVGVDPRAASRLAGALRRRAAEGACVVVATASPRDAAEIAEAFMLLNQGALAPARGRGGAESPLAGPEARVQIVADDARQLLAALAEERELTAVTCRGSALVAAGPDEDSVAAAVGRAVVRAGVSIRELRKERPQIDELRASAAGDAAGAYQAAHERARRAQLGGDEAARPTGGPPASTNAGGQR